MKRTLTSAALAVAFTIPVFAGTDTVSTPSDSKDMKDTKQVTQAAEQSDAGFYIAAFGGANFDQWYGNDKQSFTTRGGSNTVSTSNINSQWGGAGGVKVGYNFQSTEAGFLLLQPAVEVEGLYVGMDASNATNVFVPGDTERFSTNSAEFFVNGILRFKNSSIVTPYIGIGVGLDYLTTHGEIRPGIAGGPTTGLDTSDFDFAAQGIFGIDIAICQHISLFTEYKFIDAIGTDAKNSNVGAGGTYRFKPDQIEQNLITAGVKYTF